MSDSNPAPAFDARLKIVEDRVAALEGNMQKNANALQENTTLTRDVHEAVFGIEDGEKGLHQRVKEMYDIVETGRSFFRAVDKLATGLGAAADWVSKTLKRFWWVIAAGLAVATYVKTGKWELPIWPG